MIKDGDRSVITNRGTAAILKTGTTAACFCGVGSFCCDKLGLKIILRQGTNTSEQSLITKPCV